MGEVIYSARSGLPSAETTWRIAEGRLFWGSGATWRSAGLDEIRRVRIYASPSTRAWYLGGATVAQGQEFCEIGTASGETLKIGSNHFVSVGQFEDRSATWRPFVAGLVAGAAVGSPSARFESGMPPALWTLYLVTLVITGVAFLFAVMLLLGSLGHRGGDTVVGLIATGSFGAAAFGLWGVVSNGRPKPFDPHTSSI